MRARPVGEVVKQRFRQLWVRRPAIGVSRIKNLPQLGTERSRDMHSAGESGHRESRSMFGTEYLHIPTHL